MTVGTPGWIAADVSTLLPTYDATELRGIDTMYGLYDGNNLGSRPGVRPGGTSCQVTVSTMTWSVATGVVSVSGIPSGQLGEYRVPITAIESGTVPARDATFDRKDIVVVTVHDVEAGDGTRDAVVQYIAGVPASVPAAPSVPARSQLLATVTVPKVSPGNAITIVQNSQYTVPSGGILPTLTQPTNKFVGQVIYNLTNGLLERWNGTLWEDIRGGALGTWPVAWTQAPSTPLAIGNGTLEGRYQKAGRVITASLLLVRGSTTNIGSGTYQWTLPESPRDYRTVSGVGTALVAGTACPIIVQGIGSDVFVCVRTDNRTRLYNGTGAWTTGDYIAAVLTYESAS